MMQTTLSLDNSLDEAASLFVPDRYEKLIRKTSAHELKNIVEPVDAGLNLIQDKYDDMTVAGGGAFLIWKGSSGSGKSTFLHTVHLFRPEVETVSIPYDKPVRAGLDELPPSTTKLRIVVIEGREALLEVSSQELEAALHSINAFIRSPRGEGNLVTWPCNTEDLAARLVGIARHLGNDSLLGNDEPVYQFAGPNQGHFARIAAKTVHVLNNGAALVDLGVSEDRAKELATGASTIGSYLNVLRGELRQNQRAVTKLLATEQCRMWTVVIAGNDPDSDVAALTRGQFLSCDVERMMSSTRANVVEELKAFPERIGILGAVLDAKIVHIPMLTALEVARQFGNEDLHNRMNVLGLMTRSKNNAVDRILTSEVAFGFLGTPSGIRTQGRKAGSNTTAAFEKLTQIAETNDVVLNRSIGEVLQAAHLIESFKVEVDLGHGLTRRTDLYCMTKSGPVRLEIMWRKQTSRAEIANYVLTKLYNYGRAIKFFTDDN